MKNLIARIFGFVSNPAPAAEPDTYESCVDAHIAALVALTEATVALRQWTGTKPAAAMADYADSLNILKLLLTSETSK